MRLYGRGEVVLRCWNVGVKRGTRGRGVGHNQMKTELLGLIFVGVSQGGPNFVGRTCQGVLERSWTLEDLRASDIRRQGHRTVLCGKTTYYRRP